jgi:hypothetical protein
LRTERGKVTPKHWVLGASSLRDGKDNIVIECDVGTVLPDGQVNKPEVISEVENEDGGSREYQDVIDGVGGPKRKCKTVGAMGDAARWRRAVTETPLGLAMTTLVTIQGLQTSGRSFVRRRAIMSLREPKKFQVFFKAGRVVVL